MDTMKLCKLALNIHALRRFLSNYVVVRQSSSIEAFFWVVAIRNTLTSRKPKLKHIKTVGSAYLHAFGH